jgi:hypothetical protein
LFRWVSVNSARACTKHIPHWSGHCAFTDSRCTASSASLTSVQQIIVITSVCTFHYWLFMMNNINILLQNFSLLFFIVYIDKWLGAWVCCCDCCQVSPNNKMCSPQLHRPPTPFSSDVCEKTFSYPCQRKITLKKLPVVERLSMYTTFTHYSYLCQF